MYGSLLATAGLMMSGGPTLADERGDVMKTVNQYVDSLNKGDLANVIATCAKESSIVDEFPPYAWHGPNTCAKWLDALAVYNKSLGLTKGVNTLRKPDRVDVTGDRAYVVVPADFRYTANGKQGAEIDAKFTVALQKQNNAWRITGWAWSRPELDFDY
ncbi:MAG: nuclear transport factor 2 family protein [Sphingobium sp.]